jgi:hypothetical protein
VTNFWGDINRQLTELRTATTADDVLRILPGGEGGADGFFAGSGGDDTVMEALQAAGWTVIWARASYYYVMRAPDGDEITYVEGDILRGDQALRGND